MKRDAISRAEDCCSFWVRCDVVTLHNCDDKPDLTLLEAQCSSEWPDTIIANPGFIDSALAILTLARGFYG